MALWYWIEIHGQVSTAEARFLKFLGFLHPRLDQSQGATIIVRHNIVIMALQTLWAVRCS